MREVPSAPCVAEEKELDPSRESQTRPTGKTKTITFAPMS